MKRMGVALCALLMLSCGWVRADDLQGALDRRVAGAAGTGIVAAVIDHGKTTVYRAGVSGNARPLDDRTLFAIGSVSKTFTATILASMTLDGQVKLDDPISRYLPKGVRAPSYAGEQITLLDLAEQRSGLPRMPSNMDDVSGPDPYADYTLAQMDAFLGGYALTRAPGSKYEYSNLGVGLLGDLLAVRARTSYAQLLAQRVLQPLHMNDTVVASSLPDPPALAVGHDLGGVAVGTWHFGAIAPAGGILSSVDDMLSYLRCNMGSGPLARACLFAQQPRADGETGHRIGLVWWSNPVTGVISHGGDTAGFHAMIAVSKDRTRGVVVMSNGPLVGDIAAHALEPSFPIALCPSNVAPAYEDLTSYQGTYCNASTGFTFTVDPGKAPGQLSIALLPQEPLTCTLSGESCPIPSVGAVYKFARVDGHIIGVTLEQNDQEIPAERLDANGKPIVASLPSLFPAEVTLAPDVLQNYVGPYSVGGTTLTISVHGTRLFAQLSGQSGAPIFASAKDEFFYKVVDAQLSFHRNASGVVDAVTLHQDGQTITFARTAL